ncbi:MAG: sigma-70 family RNA polymerase sigma factor, partial [Chloroflexota bacterium]|nr:sigma-70 family RNA polymerase sigma factor [Chloroflexota bacterium]
VFFRVRDTPTAEDLTAQVFLKAWERVEHYQIRGLPFGAWLFQIARNLVIDHYRTRREVAPLESGDAGDLRDALDIDEVVEQRLEAERLRRALQRLTEEQRQVLTLKFIDGFSTAEIARTLGKKPGAIRALQMRGLQTLAEIMGNWNE